MFISGLNRVARKLVFDKSVVKIISNKILNNNSVPSNIYRNKLLINMPPKKKSETVAEKSTKGKTTKKTKTELSENEVESTSKPKRKRANYKESSGSESEEHKPVKVKRTKKSKTEDDGDVKVAKTKAPSKNKTLTTFDSIDFNCTKKNKIGKDFNFKISNWNVDGIRAWIKKGCLEFLKYEKPDVFCIQETKCSLEKLPKEVKEIDGYKSFWHCSTKDGYAGVGLISRKEPLSVKYGLGDEEHDDEGRIITAEYEKFYVVSVYVPNAGRGLVTLPKRLKWNDAFRNFISQLNTKKPIIVCGDMNVAHSEIDLANPKSNTKNAGFTKEEREGMTDFLSDGYIDTFRDLYPDKTQAYTFWTYLSNARTKNVGWRLDYFIVSERLMDSICDNIIRSEVFGSDHCPLTLFLNV